MSQQYHQASQQGVWMVAGPPTSAALQLGQPLTITFSDGTTASLAAHTPAITSTSATQVDRTAAVWVAYLVKGETTLRLAKESDLSALLSDYAPLARMLIDRVEPYQPEPYLASGALGGAAPAVLSACLSSTAARCQNVVPTTDNADVDYPGWSGAGFADGAWAHAVVAHYDPSQAAEIPTGASAIDDLATRPSTEGAQKLLVRQTFVLPAQAPLRASLSGGADAWGDFYVNGTHIGQAGDPSGAGSGALAATDVPASLLIAGGTNVVACQLQDIARTSTVHNRFCAFALLVSYASGALGNPGGAEGDLLYYHNGAWSRLPIGTTGSELTVVAGDPAWTAQPIASASVLGEIKVGSGLAVAGDGTLSAVASGYTDPLVSEGDLPYRHSGATTRLPVGPAGSALVSDGTDPLWGQPLPSSPLVLLPSPYNFIDQSAADNGQPPDFVMTAAGDVVSVGGM